MELGAGSSPSRSHATRSTSGSIAAYCPTAPDNLPTRSPSSARSMRTRSRSSAKAQPTSLSPNVVGSAWTPWVRPMQSVSRCSSARATTVANARSSALEQQAAGLLHGEGEGCVQDIRRCEAEVEPASVVAERLGNRVDERRDIVVGLALQLGDTLWRWVAAPGARIRSTASAGTAPTCAQPSRAASSTSSIRANLASSDQMRVMAGRE